MSLQEQANMMNNRGTTIRPDRRGLTLTELMISLSIFGVVMGVVFTFMVGSRDSYQETRQKVQYQQSMRAVISLISRELRSTGCDPTQSGFDPFAVADDVQFRCRADLNGDGDIADANPDEDVIYSYNAAAGELSRDDGSGPMVILTGLDNMIFAYRDAAGNLLNNLPLSAVDRTLIRTVDITISGETTEGDPVDYNTRISLRNG